jgi:WD40 repeat protein
MSPMQLHRTYGGCHDDITSVDWSPCGSFIAAASKDLTVRREGAGEHAFTGLVPSLRIQWKFERFVI